MLNKNKTEILLRAVSIFAFTTGGVAFSGIKLLFSAPIPVLLAS